jgi:hypothetical protein
VQVLDSAGVRFVAPSQNIETDIGAYKILRGMYVRPLARLCRRATSEKLILPA